jgi:L-threonylcarbamoyladenylate synthase
MGYLSLFKQQQICRLLAKGQVLAYPTEAVYGLGCDPLNEIAVRNLLALKQRAINKGLILIAANFGQLEAYLKYDEPILQRILTPTSKLITWVVPTQAWVPKWLTGDYQTLAIRLTEHPIAKKICDQFASPIVSTSANPSHRPPARTALQVRHYFPQATINILNDKIGGHQQPSKIYDVLTGRCLRA